MQYGDVLEDQLAGTAMGKSFARMATEPAATPAPSTGAAIAAGAASEAPAALQDDQQAGEQGGGAGTLQPVDVDLNLVSSMLESFASQQGLPGPASNMAGMLGLHLPPPTQDKQDQRSSRGRSAAR